ncbi:MAG: MinD/ParA family protein [Succinivibrio sp.]|jgi:flagellar biosynthesis protein FlhG|nr:MinD/ParA family protein [Succinivibrio sp.]
MALDATTKKRRVKVITVTGGKGGVGKSSVSLNLAVALCQMGKKVMLFDADLGLANIDVMLGLKVDKNLGHVLSGECELEDIIQTGPHGLRIVPASSGLKQMVELSMEQHAGLIRGFSTLKEDIDFFIVDTAAGISDMVLSFCRAAQDVLMVVCNEPTSVADAYAQMKVLSRDYGVKKFKIIGNSLHSLDEGKLMYQKLVTVTERFIDATLELVACIPVDMNMRKAIRQRSCVVDFFPTSPAARAFKTLANRITMWPIPEVAGGHLEFFVENLINGTKKSDN